MIINDLNFEEKEFVTASDLKSINIHVINLSDSSSYTITKGTIDIFNQVVKS